jgi:integrase
MKRKGEILQIFTNVYKRTHRNGSTSWMVRWKSAVSGRWIAVTGGRTKSEALIMEGRVREELLKGNDPSFLRASTDGEMTVGGLIDLFYEHSRFLGGSAGWKTENRARLEQWVRPALGETVVGELTKDRILKFYIFMRDRGLGRPTIHKTHTLICLLGDLHVELFPSAENVARSIRDFGNYFPKRAPKREINFLTPEELDALLAATIYSKNKLLGPLIQFLANTGLRRSEALNLTWTDVDFGAGFIHIRESKNGQSRKVPLEPAAIRALEGLDRKTHYVFSYPDGSRPHEDIFIKPLRTAAKRAGIKKRIDLHTMRHSYGSNKIRMGWGLKKVSLLLGHSDISITSNIYTHLLDGDLRVQDDFRLEGARGSHQGWNGDWKAAQAIAGAVVRALKETAENSKDALRRIEKELTAIAENQLGAAEIQRVRASSAEFRQDLADKSQTASHATLLLRNEFGALMENEMLGKDAGTFQPENREMAIKKGDLDCSSSPLVIGRGGGIRTHDLFVPNEAR